MEAATAGMITLWGAIGLLVLTLAVPGSERRRRLLWASVALAWVAVGVLVLALLSNDFTLEYVARTTSRATPWPYRLSALWGGMEGSLLFYAAMLLTVGAIGVGTKGRLEVSIVALTALGLLILTALGANPFVRLAIPAVDGGGLLAILQHPAMIYHPPILYLGLTTLVVPFALTVGYLARPPAGGWTAETRRWLMWSWTWLTIGMVTGANWAYIELGWGGFWAWDPVENTALMPWLAATVFFHASRIFDRDARMHRWTVFFALFPFVLSVLGVYLTRSGATGSIHAFAEDPVIGRILLVAAVLVTLTVVILVARAERGSVWKEVGTGRDSWLAVSSALLSIALVFIVVGSAYPAFLSVFWDRTVVVGPRFFITTILPIAILIAAFTGFALNTKWSRAALRRTDAVLFLVSAIPATVLAVFLAIEVSAAGVLLLGLATGAAAVLIGDIRRRGIRGRRRVGLLAHLGIVVVLIGAGGSSLGSEFTGPMVPGDTVTVGPHTVELVEVSLGETDRFIYAEGLFLLDGRSELRPQIRAYERQALPVAEPALRTTPFLDIIIAVTLLTPDGGGFEVSVFVRPMVWWVWAGAVLLAVSGVFALVSRDGASSRRRREATEGPLQTGTTSEAKY